MIVSGRERGRRERERDRVRGGEGEEGERFYLFFSVVLKLNILNVNIHRSMWMDSVPNG